MILPGMAKDIVDLVRVDGERVDGIKAVISPRRIVTFQTDIEINPKEIMIRKMADGADEAYLLLDPVLIPAQDGIPENYQITVRRVEFPG